MHSVKDLSRNTYLLFCWNSSTPQIVTETTNSRLCIVNKAKTKPIRNIEFSELSWTTIHSHLDCYEGNKLKFKVASDLEVYTDAMCQSANRVYCSVRMNGKCLYQWSVFEFFAAPFYYLLLLLSIRFVRPRFMSCCFLFLSVFV